MTQADVFGFAFVATFGVVAAVAVIVIVIVLLEWLLIELRDR